jgi:hypothetical protein
MDIVQITFKVTLPGEVRDPIHEQVAQLPEDQCRVVILHDHWSEDWEQIAAELDRDDGATRRYTSARGYDSFRRRAGGSPDANTYWHRGRNDERDGRAWR